MFAVFSTIFWVLAQPVSLVFGLVVIGLVLGAIGWRRLGLAMGALGALTLFLSAYTSLGFLLIRPLEERFERPEPPPAEVAAIVVLGGSTLARVSTARGIAELNEGGDRLTEAMRLAQLYPDSTVVFSGGGGTFDPSGEAEAETAARFLVGLGLDPDRLVLEGQSRNTDENVALSAELIGDVSGEILLVTSAFHMPRAVGLFRREGLTMVPWPTDYRGSGVEPFGVDLANPVHNLNTLTVALREWIGLAVYAATGRIDEMFPGP